MRKRSARKEERQGKRKKKKQQQLGFNGFQVIMFSCQWVLDNTMPFWWMIYNFLTIILLLLKKYRRNKIFTNKA